jgi:antitoxin component of RelBE/YafQ-DinJ toxin-antitoxin module
MAELKLRIDDMTKTGIQQMAKKKGVSMNEYVDVLLRDHLQTPAQYAREDMYDKTIRQLSDTYQKVVQILEQKLGQYAEVIARNTDALDEVRRKL